MEEKEFISKLSKQLEELNQQNAKQSSFKYLDASIYPQEYRNLIIAINQTIETGEDKTRQEQNNIKMLHDIINSGSWNIDFDEKGQLKTVTYSQSFRSILGYRDEKEFPNELDSFLRKIHPDDRVSVLEKYKKAIDEKYPERIYEFEYRVLTKDEEYRWYKSSGEVTYSRDEIPVKFSGTFIDITAEKQNQQLMDVIKALCIDYDTVFEINTREKTFVPFIMNKYLLGKINKIIHDNEEWDEVLAQYCKIMVSPSYQEALFKAGCTESLISQLSTQNTFEYEYKINSEDKENFYLMKAVRLVDFEKSGLIVAGFQNVTSIRESEHQQAATLAEALAQSRYASEAKTRFLSNMSHDMRTPMNAIIGFATLALAHIEDEARVKDSLEKVLASSNHLLNLINDILDMSRIESGRISLNEMDCNLSVMIHDLVNIIHGQVKTKKLNFYLDTFNVKNEDIYVDSLKLSQILINVASNAVKYTPAGGTIILKIEELPSQKQGYSRYVFKTKDNGIGMTEEFVRHIFEPFERENSTTKSGIEGTGLGMTITKSITDLMGGTIAVKSQKNKGSEFIITLDIKVLEKPKKNYIIEEIQQKRALVVDTDMYYSTSIAKMFTDIGFNTEWTTSLEESVKRVKNSLEQDSYFDTIAFEYDKDNTLVKQTIKQIKELYKGKDVNILIYSYEMPDESQDNVIEDIDGVIIKPLFISNVYEKIKKVKKLTVETDKKEKSWTEIDFHNRRILLVEDNELNMEIAKSILEETGFTVFTAPDGSDAVKMVEDSKEFFYDAILMDIQMPVMNGYEATRIIRNLRRLDVKKIPIFAMTANVMEDDKEQVFRNGMTDHIAKPIVIKKFLETLGEYLS